MRSRERLVFVMRSVNRWVHPVPAIFLFSAADHIEANEIGCPECLKSMTLLVDEYPSQHIRELAAEAKLYLEVKGTLQ
jgi:hypothetical protein